MRNCFLLIMLFGSFSAVANRVNPDCQGPNRCSNEALPQNLCNEDREDALKTGCITREEYDRLVHYNTCPSCNRRNQYKGCCPPVSLENLY